MKLVPYLNFQGSAEEALNLYQKIFDGNITDVNRFGDRFPVPDDYKNKIMHARLSFGDNLLMFSDTMPDGVITPGNAINLSIGIVGEPKARSVFDQLAEGGKIKRPMEKQFWGAIFGEVTDKYGIHWMVNCDI